MVNKDYLIISNLAYFVIFLYFSFLFLFIISFANINSVPLRFFLWVGVFILLLANRIYISICIFKKLNIALVPYLLNILFIIDLIWLIYLLLTDFVYYILWMPYIILPIALSLFEIIFQFNLKSKVAKY